MSDLLVDKKAVKIKSGKESHPEVHVHVHFMYMHVHVPVDNPGPPDSNSI